MKLWGPILVSIVVIGSTVPAALPVSAGTGTINGQLVDGDSGTNAPAAGITVQACSNGGCAASAVSDSNGNYTLTGVPSGTWSVVTFPPTPCADGDFARAQASGVTVGDSQTINAPTIILTRAKGSIAGNVVDKTTGAGVAGVSIFADNAEQGGNGYQGATTGADGSYRLDCLPAQRGYFITATPSSVYVHQADSQFTVTAGQTLPHTMLLTRGTAIMVGKVTCGGKPCSPQPGILVLQFCGLGSTGSANPCALSNVTPNSDGTWATPSNSLVGGNYTVHVFAPPGWDNAARFNVPVKDGMANVSPNIDLAQNGGNSGRLTGQVTDAAGAPYENCRVNTFDQQSQPAGSARGQGFLTGTPTDQNGNFDTGATLTPNPNGWYRVWLDCPGHDEVTTNLDASGHRLAPQAGQTQQVNFFWPEPPRPYTGGDTAIGAAQPSQDAYFAEGTTHLDSSSSYHEYLTVQNPNAADETLSVKYILGTSQTISKTYVLNAKSRKTINVNAEVGPNQRVGAWLHVDAPGSFVAERPMYFEYPGGIDGGDDVIGAQALGTVFNFAEGFTGAGFHESLALLNPGTSDANVNVTYFFNGGRAPLTVPRTIPAHTAVSEDVNQDVGLWQEVSIQVTAVNSVQFLAERSMYFPFPTPTGKILTGGHVVVGTSQASQHLNLAEGYAGNGFYEYLTLLNSDPVNAATATITYEFQGGGTKQVTVPVPAHSRVTRLVNNDLPNGTANSVHIDSDVALVVERPMYFTYQGRTGGHVAMAVDDSQLGMSFNFAEGFVRSCSGSPCFDEYYTILNNTANNATVTITYFLEGGGTVVKTFPVLAHSRYTRWVNQPNDPGQVGGDLPAFTSNSAQITSTQPILVERPMYFAY